MANLLNVVCCDHVLLSSFDSFNGVVARQVACLLEHYMAYVASNSCRTPRRLL